MKALTHLSAGMTLWEAREESREANQRAVYRGHEYHVSPPRFILEIVSDETWVEDILKALAEVYKGEPFDDRNVRIFTVEASYHVRTGFMDL